MRNHLKGRISFMLLEIIVLVALILLSAIVINTRIHGQEPENRQTLQMTSDVTKENTSSEESSSAPPPSEESTAEPDPVPEINGPVIDPNDWRLVLASPAHQLPQEEIASVKIEKAHGYQMDERIIPELNQMFDDAQAAGHSLSICSGYRTYSGQQKLLDERIKKCQKKGYSYEKAYNESIRYVQLPGCSEHNVGLALDITPKSNLNLVASLENTKEIQWLHQNCYRYGFIVRYPKAQEKQDITGITYEPWHFRYVGVEHATKITELGVTLEEYLGVA